MRRTLRYPEEMGDGEDDAVTDNVVAELVVLSVAGDGSN